MRGWRPALRLAWRDAWKAKGRSILVLVMIALPVLAVTAASVVRATSDVSGVDAIPRTMGSAAARIEPVGGVIVQAPDPRSGTYFNRETGDRPTLDDLTQVLGGRRTIPITGAEVNVTLDDRRIRTVVTEVDLRDPLAEGLFDLRSGDLPAAAGEAVINEAFAERGLSVGDTLDVLGAEVTVVGIGRDASFRATPTIAAPRASFGSEFDDTVTDWLVGGDALVWADVRALNAHGALVSSRAVITDPPPIPPELQQMGYDSGSGDYIAVVALVIAMTLLEVVLLAGPAFAVGARRQARSLALMAACGGTPRQARRVVLASGAVLGAVAALVGAVLGVLLGLGVLPLVQRFSDAWFGPVDIDLRVVAIVAVFGMLSAVLAAVAPAWLASRQDVVAVLAGRRGDAPPSARTPVFGAVVLVVGIALSVFGAKGSRSLGSEGSYAIAVGAIVAVIGMIFVVPLVVSGLARISGRLPLVPRYAARDAARHRTRTVPAIAAVAATVAGVVALGIANSSDEAENRETYIPSLAMGAATLGVNVTYDMNYDEASLPSDDVWDRIDGVLAQRLPGVKPEVIRGQRSELADGKGVNFELFVDGQDFFTEYANAPSGAMTLVSDGPVPGLIDVDDEQRSEITSALEDGRAVVFTDTAVDAAEVKVKESVFTMNSGEEPEVTTTFTWPALFVETSRTPPAQLILPSALAEETASPVSTVGYYFPDAQISPGVEKELNETLGGLDEGASLYVERGYQARDAVVILLLVLFTLGGVLMLGGTLTSTFLALSDARPDLATLAAVGAAPRSRRGVAASYALVVGFVGAVLGAMVGFIPGVAITYPLTTMASGVCISSNNGPVVCENGGPYLDIPWLMIGGLVIALPLLTALIVGLTARSRLPMVSRLT